MSTLTVWKFDDPEGANKAVDMLEDLQRQAVITVHDAATVSWEPGAKKPKTRQLAGLTGAGAMGGAFWGLLFGLIFFVPLLGMAVGAAAGALSGSMADVGIDDEFIASIRAKVQPGTSALFAMTSDAVTDKVAEVFGDVEAELIYTNLSADEEARLRDVFGD